MVGGSGTRDGVGCLTAVAVALASGLVLAFFVGIGTVAPFASLLLAVVVLFLVEMFSPAARETPGERDEKRAAAARADAEAEWAKAHLTAARRAELQGEMDRLRALTPHALADEVRERLLGQGEHVGRCEPADRGDPPVDVVATVVAADVSRVMRVYVNRAEGFPEGMRPARMSPGGRYDPPAPPPAVHLVCGVDLAAWLSGTETRDVWAGTR